MKYHAIDMRESVAEYLDSILLRPNEWLYDIDFTLGWDSLDDANKILVRLIRPVPSSPAGQKETVPTKTDYRIDLNIQFPASATPDRIRVFLHGYLVAYCPQHLKTVELPE